MIFLPHPKTCVAIVAKIATAVVTPTVHRFTLNALLDAGSVTLVLVVPKFWRHKTINSKTNLLIFVSERSFSM